MVFSKLFEKSIRKYLFIASNRLIETIKGLPKNSLIPARHLNKSWSAP